MNTPRGQQHEGRGKKNVPLTLQGTNPSIGSDVDDGFQNQKRVGQTVKPTHPFVQGPVDDD